MSAHPGVRRAAREDGLPRALAVLCDEVLPGSLPCGPGGHALVPAAVAAAADRVHRDGRVYDRAAGEEEVVLRGGPLVVLRHRCGGAALDVDGAGASAEEWALGLLWLRLGLSEGLLDACVRHLDGRACGDGTVLRQQMVKGAVADVLVEHLEVHAVLTAGTPDAAHLHGQITTADRALLRLLGASGYLSDGPGEAAYRSEVLAEVYAEVAR